MWGVIGQNGLLKTSKYFNIDSSRTLKRITKLFVTKLVKSKHPSNKVVWLTVNKFCLSFLTSSFKAKNLSKSLDIISKKNIIYYFILITFIPIFWFLRMISPPPHSSGKRLAIMSRLTKVNEHRFIGQKTKRDWMDIQTHFKNYFFWLGVLKIFHDKNQYWFYLFACCCCFTTYNLL